MHRTQISLEDDQYQNLRHYAQSRRQSISAIIRGLVDVHVPDMQADDKIENSLQKLKGIVSGKGETKGRDHNEHLYKHEEHWSSEKP